MRYLIPLILFSSCMFKDGKYVDDNIFEEVAESILESKTGLDLDFTPSSQE